MRTIGLSLALLLGCSAIVSAAERTTTLGVEAAFGTEQEMFGSGPSSGVQLGMLHLQVLTRFGHNQPGQTERFQLVNELSLIESLWPKRRFMVSLIEVGRYTFTSGSWRPYAEVGAGISSSALHSPDITELDGWLQYQLRVGAGFKHPLCGGKTLVLGTDLTHFSNNGTTYHNLGLNLLTVTVGLNF